jgi:hypothetical protein
LELTFSLPANLVADVDACRRAKIAQLDGVLGRLPNAADHPWGGHAEHDLPLRYALAHHVFETVSRAAAAGDVDTVVSAMRLRTNQDILRPLSATSGTVLVAHPDLGLFTEDAALAEAPVALVSPTICGSANGADRSLVAQALATAVDAGFSSTVTRNARVVVMIAERVPTDTTIRSWTTTALPVTVHLDYFAEHWYVSRDLIHEAAHTELNDLFSTLDISFPADVTYFAPWLQTHRPAFGFLHGVWAFSHVALYSAWLAEADAPPQVRALSWAIYLKHAEQIHEARDDIDRALELMSNSQLAEVIQRYRDQVLDSLRPTG